LELATHTRQSRLSIRFGSRGQDHELILGVVADEDWVISTVDQLI
jgi:hypothetical protein